MIAIEISDSDDGLLTVELQDLLFALPEEAKHLWWSILDLEATGDLGPGKNMLDLEKRDKDLTSRPANAMGSDYVARQVDLPDHQRNICWYYTRKSVSTFRGLGDSGAK